VEYLYCSNVPAMNGGNIPIWNSTLLTTQASSSGIPGASLDAITHANFAVVTGVLSQTGPPGAAAAQFRRPCVKWYGPSYPISTLYERDPGVTGAAIRDSSFMAKPLSGWESALSNLSYFDPLTITQYSVQQLASSNLYGFDTSQVTASQLGVKEKGTAVTSIPSGTQFFTAASSSLGLFGTIPTTYYFNLVDFLFNT
jgi:hypothetical protein